MFRVLCLLLFSISFSTLANVQDVFVAPTQEQIIDVELFQFESLEKQQRAIALAKSLRCPRCQNQNLVESNSPIAKDLRLIVFKKINSGESEQQVVEFMTARYGEFVLYKPSLTWGNALLWGAPILAMFLFLTFSIKRVVSSKRVER